MQFFGERRHRRSVVDQTFKVGPQLLQVKRCGTGSAGLIAQRFGKRHDPARASREQREVEMFRTSDDRFYFWFPVLQLRDGRSRFVEMFRDRDRQMELGNPPKSASKSSSFLGIGCRTERRRSTEEEVPSAKHARVSHPRDVIKQGVHSSLPKMCPHFGGYWKMVHRRRQCRIRHCFVFRRVRSGEETALPWPEYVTFSPYRTLDRRPEVRVSSKRNARIKLR